MQLKLISSMSTGYWRLGSNISAHFRIPATDATFGGVGGNNITMRGNEIPEGIPSGMLSKTLPEAHFKALRLYRKICRLMPFILRIHYLAQRVNLTEAKLNVANYFRLKDNKRDIGEIDWSVAKGYEILSETEWHYLQREQIFKFVSPEERRPSDRGYSFLDDVRFKNKTSFLKDFYVGSRPYEY